MKALKIIWRSYLAVSVVYCGAQATRLLWPTEPILAFCVSCAFLLLFMNMLEDWVKS